MFAPACARNQTFFLNQTDKQPDFLPAASRSSRFNGALMRRTIEVTCCLDHDSRMKRTDRKPARTAVTIRGMFEFASWTASQAVDVLLCICKLI